MYRIVLFIVGLCIVVGCGGREWPPTYKTTGVVTLDGEPVVGATVSFYPTSEGQEPANGTTDSAGRYEMTSFNKNDGAMAGQFKVCVVRFAQPEIELTAEGTQWDPEQETGEESTDDGNEHGDLPEKYSSPEESGLSVSINKNNENVANFELSSK